MCALHAQIAPSSTSQKLRLFQIASVASSFKKGFGVARAMPNFASHFWKIKISLSFFEEEKIWRSCPIQHQSFVSLQARVGAEKLGL